MWVLEEFCFLINSTNRRGISSSLTLVGKAHPSAKESWDVSETSKAVKNFKTLGKCYVSDASYKYLNNLS